MKKFGLRRKREIWKAESILRNFRRRAREIAASGKKEEEKILLEKLNRVGLLESMLLHLLWTWQGLGRKRTEFLRTVLLSTLG